jgi:Acetyltransferases, including N-acetylases of ribosomal proteins
MDILRETRVEGKRERAIEALRAECEAFDGVSDIEMASSLNAHRDMAWLFLAEGSGAEGSGAEEPGELAGALTIFAPRSDEAEIGALVRPGSRMRGVFSALLREAEGELARFGYSSELFTVNGRSESGAAVAARLGARYEYTEYEMRFAGGAGTERESANKSRLELRLATSELFDDLVDLRLDAFGGSREDAASFERSVISSPDQREYGAWLGGRLIGAGSIASEEAGYYIHGIVVRSGFRGKGYGSELVTSLVDLAPRASAEEESSRPIRLEVESRNEAAKRVYEKCGFAVSGSTAYYRRPLR